MYVCMYVCMYIGMYVCMYVYRHTYIHAYIHTCVYIYILGCAHSGQWSAVVGTDHHSDKITSTQKNIATTNSLISTNIGMNEFASHFT